MSNTEKSDRDNVEPDTVDHGIPEGVSFALIHEASSMSNFGALSDPTSIESQVARNRGKALEQKHLNDVNGNSDDEGLYELQVEEGRLKTKSGYVIRFVNEEHLDLSPFDIAGLDSLKAYPAPEELIDNLTARMRGHLKEHGYVKVRGAYSADEKRFYGVKMGWELDEEMDVWDRLMEVITEVSTTPAAIDYVFVKEGPDRWGVDEVAEARGIAPSSVRGNIRGIENELDK